MKEQFGSKTSYLIDRYNALIEISSYGLAKAYRNEILRLRTYVTGGAEFAKMYRDAYKDCKSSGLGWMQEWHPDNVLKSKPTVVDTIIAKNFRVVEVIEEDVCDNPYLLLG